MSKSKALDYSLLEFKTQLARKLMVGCMIFCAIGLPISLSRWPEIGFQWVFIHHIVLTIMIGLCYFRPDKTNYKLDLIVIVLFLTSMIVSGTLTFGLQSGAITYTIFSTVLIALTWGFLRAFVYALAWCTYLIVLGYLFANGYVEYSIRPDVYSATIGAWIVVALCSGVITILMIVSFKQAFVCFGSLVQEIEKQKLEIEQLANTDSVTGFCAARLAMPMLTQAISLAQREQSKVGVVFIDLNNFKAINDNFGHDAGDFVLQETANRIRNVLRGMDTSCRIGGDEFLFIIPKINDVSEIHMILQRVIATWAEPVSFENAKLKVTGSIGVAMYPDDSDCPQELRKKADAAMYYAKDNGLALKFFS